MRAYHKPMGSQVNLFGNHNCILRKISREYERDRVTELALAKT
jgi:hypothetical protein